MKTHAGNNLCYNLCLLFSLGKIFMKICYKRLDRDRSVTIYLRLNITSKEINLWYTLLAFPLPCYSDGDAQDEQFDRLAIVSFKRRIIVYNLSVT